MSIHSSLRGADTLKGERSVFKRIERVQKLIKDGKLAEDGSAFGLPKVRTRFKVAKKKVEPAPAAAAAAATTAAAPATPAPTAAAAGKPAAAAAAGKPAKGGKSASKS
jgi:small basic protein (TIGR04137 family)